MNIVISQSMYFPWVGILEQIRLADIFVHYDDVQYSKGGFLNRVQIKTANGIKWLTLPLDQYHLGDNINEIKLNKKNDWRCQHRDILAQAYQNAPFKNEMLSLVDTVFSNSSNFLSDIARESMMQLIKYFGLENKCEFIDSLQFGIGGSSTKRVYDIVRKCNGKRYITGHGARNYLEHELFEKSGISVDYMKYELMEYDQLHGAFTPYVSSLDLIANCGREGAKVICSKTINWKEFVK